MCEKGRENCCFNHIARTTMKDLRPFFKFHRFYVTVTILALFKLLPFNNLLAIEKSLKALWLESILIFVQ